MSGVQRKKLAKNQKTLLGRIIGHDKVSELRQGSRFLDAMGNNPENPKNKAFEKKVNEKLTTFGEFLIGTANKLKKKKK